MVQLESVSEAVDHFENYQREMERAVPPLEVPETRVVEGGREIIRTGNIERAREVWHEQQDNELGFRGTCGLASIAACLRLLGIQVTENDVVRFAAEYGLCNVSDNPETSGGTNPLEQVQIFKHYGIPAQMKEIADVGPIIKALANGQCVIIEVNAGILWKEEFDDSITEHGFVENYGSGRFNHAIEVVGFDRDRITGELVRFYVNDTGAPGGAAHSISRETLTRAVMSIPTGKGMVGYMVATDLHRAPPTV
jgi:Peptidase_C39 like family